MLHHRLGSWMPARLKFCSPCEKFTGRKRQHGGRCKCGLVSFSNAERRMRSGLEIAAGFGNN
jgi:hypothetical protein